MRDAYLLVLRGLFGYPIKDRYNDVNECVVETLRELAGWVEVMCFHNGVHRVEIECF